KIIVLWSAKAAESNPARRTEKSSLAISAKPVELGLGVKPYEQCRRTLRLWWIFCGFPRNVPSLLALLRKTARPLSRHNDWCAWLNPVEKLFGLLHGQSNTAM